MVHSSPAMSNRETLPDDDEGTEKPKHTSKGKTKSSGPSTDGDGKDKKTGRFVKGNPGGPGNPHMASVQKNRSNFLRYFCTEPDVHEVRGGLSRYEYAEKVVWERLFGKNSITTDPITGRKIHPSIADQKDWIKITRDRAMGKVPDTLITKEWTPPEDPNQNDDLALGW